MKCSGSHPFKKFTKTQVKLVSSLEHVVNMKTVNQSVHVLFVCKAPGPGVHAHGGTCHRETKLSVMV